MKSLNKLDILEQAREYNVKFIRLQFTDIFGVFKNIAITVEELSKALEGKIVFDSSVINGTVSSREREIFLVPDPETFVIFPWRPREGAVARLICDAVQGNGELYECCSRQVLKRTIKDVEKMGLKAMVGTENEFFLFHTDDKNNPTTFSHDTAGFCDVSPVDLGENARRDMVLTLEEMGFEISSSHHEFAPGQHEISLKFDDAVTMADRLVTFRFVVRTIARRHGLHASFMPKPVNGLSGSGLHVYQSLFDGLDNIFYNSESKDGLSDNARYYIGGILKHIASITAVTNPIINSYKRLVPAENTPCFAAWSTENRCTVIKAPADRGDETRIELRNPDSACNPYLALAVMLQAGIEGIKNKITPPPPTDIDVSCMLDGDLQRSGIKRLPRTLDEAVRALELDDLIVNTLGTELAYKFITAKRKEWESFNSFVHQWEVDKYLGIY